MPDTPLAQWSNEELWQLFPIELSSHKPEWREAYAAEESAIRRSVGEKDVLRIHHIGSTAVPGLIAKPTVDVLLEITDGADLVKLKTSMENLGYLYSPQPNNPAPHAMYLKGYTPQGYAGQCFHVHVRYAGDWDELYFRDYLRAHSDAARQYGNLKTALQKQFRQDRDGYTAAKTEFVRKITALGRAGRAGDTQKTNSKGGGNHV